jgi:hypothetical protein
MMAEPLTDIQCRELAAELTAILRGRRGKYEPHRHGYDQPYRSDEIRHLLASEYGRRHGWRRTRREFHWGQLTRGSNQSSIHEEWLQDWPRNGEPTDHPYYFRDNLRPWRPSAVIGHSYNWDGASGWLEQKADRLCQRHILTMKVETDFPSWWVPGDTTMLVFTRDEARWKALWDEARRMREQHGRYSLDQWVNHLGGWRWIERWPPLVGFGSAIPRSAFEENELSRIEPWE